MSKSTNTMENRRYIHKIWLPRLMLDVRGKDKLKRIWRLHEGIDYIVSRSDNFRDNHHFPNGGRVLMGDDEPNKRSSEPSMRVFLIKRRSMKNKWPNYQQKQVYIKHAKISESKQFFRWTALCS